MSTAVLFDLDGTLYEGDRLLPGAAEAVLTLRNAGMPVRFLTNTTRTSRRVLVAKLLRLGLAVESAEVFTAPVAAASLLAARGIRRVKLLLPEAAHEDFAMFELSGDRPECVVAGDLGAAWDFAVLNSAFRALMTGADLLALQKNRYWKDRDGLSLDAGPFVAALEYASGKEAELVGKPGEEFFQAAIRSSGAAVHKSVMVGDDIRGDVKGAQNIGMKGVLVRTGKFREDDVERSGVLPDLVIDSVADLAECLPQLVSS